MQYKNINTEEANENVSKENHLKEIFLIIIALLASAIIFYTVLGFSVNTAVEYLTPEMENHLLSISNKISVFRPGVKSEKYQNLLDNLISKSSLNGRDIQLRIIPGKDINAFAIAGNTIVLVDSLLKKLKSENELAMILGHELGHFHYRHHLKGLGRGVVLAIVSYTLFGNNNSFSNFFEGMLNFEDLKFSRKDEMNCDLYGLDLLNKQYGHVNGADGFYKMIDDNSSSFVKYFLTHPISKERMMEINKYAMKQGYSMTGKLKRLTYDTN